MKKPIFILLMAFGMNVAAQADFVNRTFSFDALTGYDSRKRIVFDMYVTREDILNSRHYREKLKEYSDTLPSDDDRINRFLRSSISFTIAMGRTDLKKPTSLDYPDGAVGSLFLDKNGMIAIQIPFKSQNSYGNYLLGKMIYMNDEVYIYTD